MNFRVLSDGVVAGLMGAGFIVGIILSKPLPYPLNVVVIMGGLGAPLIFWEGEG